MWTPTARKKHNRKTSLQHNVAPKGVGARKLVCLYVPLDQDGLRQRANSQEQGQV
jgi:hypothetical protein